MAVAAVETLDSTQEKQPTKTEHAPSYASLQIEAVESLKITSKFGDKDLLSFGPNAQHSILKYNDNTDTAVFATAATHPNFMAGENENFDEDDDDEDTEITRKSAAGLENEERSGK